MSAKSCLNQGICSYALALFLTQNHDYRAREKKSDRVYPNNRTFFAAIQSAGSHFLAHFTVFTARAGGDAKRGRIANEKSHRSPQAKRHKKSGDTVRVNDRSLQIAGYWLFSGSDVFGLDSGTKIEDNYVN